MKATIEATLTMRPPPSAIIARTTYLVSTMGDSVFRRTRRSIFEVCMSESAPSSPSAALLTRPWIGPTLLRSAATKRGMASMSSRSNGRNCRALVPARAEASIAAASSRLSLRAIAMAQ